MPKSLRFHTGSRILAFLALVIAAGAAGCQTAPLSLADNPQKHVLSIEQAATLEGIRRAGFDVDDTLLFSTGAFRRGFESGHRYDSDAFWALVNTSDRGNSTVKKAARLIIDRYRTRGIELYAITARSPIGGSTLAAYLHEIFGIPEENVFFEPESKVARIREARLDVFFGDSDSDIRDAMEAGVRAIRFQRSAKSSYKNKDGTLKKYHPGMFGEEIVHSSEG